MLTLAVDTSGEYGSIALADEKGLREELPLHAPAGFSGILFREIAALLTRNGVTLPDVELFAAASGPGAFTGVRVGLAAIKGLAETSGKRASAISTLDALAAFGTQAVRAPLIDARRGEVYAAILQDESVLLPECVLPLPRFVELAGEQIFEWVCSDFEPFREQLCGWPASQYAVAHAPARTGCVCRAACHEAPGVRSGLARSKLRAAFRCRIALSETRVFVRLTSGETMARAARQLKLAGVFAAAVTPHREGSLDADYTASLELLDFLAAGGVDGICLFGATGEFLNFSLSDRQRLVYLASKRSRVPLLVGVGHSTLAGALQLAHEAIDGGADGLLVMPPYFYRYGQAQIEEFFRRFAHDVGDAVPLVLYNIPQFTSAIKGATAGLLLKDGLYAGIKDSSGDWTYFEELLSMRRSQEFALLAGNDRVAARAMSMGADGVISGCACALPELLVSLKNAVRGCDASLVAKLDTKLMAFIEWIEKFPVPVGINCAVAVRGQKSAPPSVPLSPSQREELLRFEEWLRAEAI